MRWLIVVCLVLAACIYAHLEEALVLAGVADDLHGRGLLLCLQLLHVHHREGNRGCHLARSLALVSHSLTSWLARWVA